MAWMHLGRASPLVPQAHTCSLSIVIVVVIVVVVVVVVVILILVVIVIVIVIVIVVVVVIVIVIVIVFQRDSSGSSCLSRWGGRDGPASHGRDLIPKSSVRQRCASSMAGSCILSLHQPPLPPLPGMSQMK